MRFLLAVMLLLPASLEARALFHRCWSENAPAQAPGHLVSELTTRFKAKNRARASNVRRAARSLDGVVIGPYQRVSYNEIVGPRTAQTGFRLAPVIDRGRLVYEPGGGVCQPSSTLHAAALLGGLKIEERRPHTWTSVYVAPGLDAAVAWGVKDLVIKNPFPFPVRIAAEISTRHITMMLYGAEPRRGWYEVTVKEVQRRPYETTIDEDPDLEPGTEQIVLKGLDGIRIERQRVRVLDGRRWAVRLSDDVYYKRDAIIHRGPPVQAALRSVTPTR